MTIAAPAVSYAVRILERQQCQRGGGCECRAAARRGHGKTHCIVHDDPGPSLAVQERNGHLLVRCHAGCEQAVVIGALREAGLWPEQAQRVAGSGRSIVGKYDYRDAQGRLLYQTVRYKPKGFKQRRPDGPGAWIWKLDEPDAGLHTPRVLYRLPELQAADPAATVFVVEGEKDVDRLRALGLVATCNVGGASQWRHEYGEALRGRDVVVLPDNDDAGRKHVRQVADSLDGKSARVRIVALPGLPEHGDVSDWLESHSVDDLLAVCRSDELVPDTVWPEPEDRGDAVPSEQGAIEFVEDLLRPGRILVWGAEEGTGKSFATDGELAIRLAVAGGLFAGTWPVLRNGPVLVLSEMHSDDDYEREATCSGHSSWTAAI